MFPLQARCDPEVGLGIALLFHDRSTKWGWVVSSTPRPHFTPGKDTVPILQEAGWAPRQVWTGGKLVPTGIRSRTVQPVAQSLYRLSYPAHNVNMYCCIKLCTIWWENRDLREDCVKIISYKVFKNFFLWRIIVVMKFRRWMWGRSIFHNPLATPCLLMHFIQSYTTVY